MKEITSREFQQKVGMYQDMAQKEPITITRYDRPSFVLLSFDDYQKLTGHTRRALHVSQLSDDDLKAILASEIPKDLPSYDDEMND